MKIQTQIKQLFFDRAAVIKAIGKKEAKAMSRIGAFLRRRARSLIRSAGKKGTSASSGQPPRYHPPEDSVRTLRNIQFYYDPGSKTLVTGPILLPGKPAIDKTVPNLLEFSGDVTRGRKTYHYSGNPFMAPALKAELQAGTIPAQFGSGVSAAP